MRRARRKKQKGPAPYQRERKRALVRGFLVVLAGPTGVGETTVTRAVIRRLPRAKRLLTTTSRPKRPGEKQGREYEFLTRREFERRIGRKKFLEYIYLPSRKVYYGTDRTRIERELARGAILFANLEVRGLRVMRREYSETVALFLKPENLQQIVLRKLKQHPNITKRELTIRLREAKRELREARYYDHTIVNRDGKLQETVRAVLRFIRCHAATLDGG